MLLSIIIPVFNTEKYLSKCLDSIIEQDFLDLEVITVNDGSIDNSMSILENYSKIDSRIHVLNQDNKGVVAARNLGLSSASGEWIMFVDSDDYLLPGCLSKLFVEAVNNKADIVVGNIIYDYGKSKIERFNKKTDGDNLKELNKALLCDNITPALYARLYKKNIFERIEVSDEFKIGEDFITTILLFSRAKKIVFIDYPSYGYLQRDDSVMHQPSKLAVESIPKFINWVINYYSNMNFYSDEDFQNELAYFAITRYYLYLSWGGSKKTDFSLDKVINENYLNKSYIRKRIPSWRYWMLVLYKKSNVLGEIYRVLFITLSKRIKIKP